MAAYRNHEERVVYCIGKINRMCPLIQPRFCTVPVMISETECIDKA